MPDRAGRRVTDAIATLAAELRAAGIETADLDARILVLAAGGLERLDLVRNPEKQIGPDGEVCLEGFRRRRLDREPVSRILGRREFWSLTFEVTPAVLDPRPDTETLVESALGYIRRSGLDRTPIRLLDLGTGSGAILVALLHELPLAFGVGIDRSYEALAVARRNAERNGVGDRAAFVQGDWASALRGPVDLIVSNPPYLTTADIGAAEPEVSWFDPRLALDGGKDGMNAYRALVADWQRLGRPPLILEVGAQKASQITDLINENPAKPEDSTIEVVRDLAGKERIVAVWPQFRFP